MNHVLNKEENLILDDTNTFRYTISRSIQIVLNKEENLEAVVQQHMTFVIDDFKRENGTLGHIHITSHRLDRKIEKCTIEYLTGLILESAKLLMSFSYDNKKVLDVRISSDIDSTKISSNDAFPSFKKFQCNSVHNSNRDVLTAVIGNDSNTAIRIASINEFDNISPKKIDNSHMIMLSYDVSIATEVLFGHVMNYGTVCIQHSSNTIYEAEELAFRQAALVNAIDKIDTDFEFYVDKLIQYRSFDFKQNTPKSVVSLMQYIKGLLIFSQRIDSIMPRYVDKLLKKVRLDSDVTTVIDDLIIQLCMPIRVIGVYNYKDADDKSVMLYDEIDSNTGHTTIECYTKDQLDENDFLPEFVAAGLVAISEGYGSEIEESETETIRHDVNILTEPMRSWNTFIMNFHEMRCKNSL